MSSSVNNSGWIVTRVCSETLATRDKSAIIQSSQLAKELHKPIIRKLEKRKV